MVVEANRLEGSTGEGIGLVVETKINPVENVERNNQHEMRRALNLYDFVTITAN